MKSVLNLPKILFCILILLPCTFCARIPEESARVDRLPAIYPDYTNVTIPPNIAPLNFKIKEDGEKFVIAASSEKSNFRIAVSSGDGTIMFPMKAWKRLTEESSGSRIKIETFAIKANGSEGYLPFYMNVAPEKIDPYLVYRLIFPGYYSWSHIKIMQRNLENFSEQRVIDNQVLDNNCINCHSFNNNNPDRFMVHIRGSRGGTYFVDEGKITRTDPKVETMPGSATYPSWHPGGRYVAFSSNQVRQSFYAATKKSIEVYDIISSMIVYDREKNLIRTVNEDDTANCMRTFPSWSSDGKYLYYCKAVNKNPGSNPYFGAIENIHYDLVRKPFNPDSCTFGHTEMVFDAAAINKSVSFPRISPDGKKLVFTLHDFGTFPIWHPEADLYILDMETGKSEKMTLNSDFTESYHTWSHNGKWLVFSSKRSDGRSTRPYFSYIGQDGHAEKPFMLPQKNPEIYNEMLESFNIPELVTGKIKMTPRDFEAASGNPAVKAMQGDKVDKTTVLQKPESKTEGGKPVHE